MLAVRREGCAGGQPIEVVDSGQAARTWSARSAQSVVSSQFPRVRPVRGLKMTSLIHSVRDALSGKLMSRSGSPFRRNPCKYCTYFHNQNAAAALNVATDL